ncbi:MAG TPA: hypothetical protein VFL51_13395 [Pseudolabrys sp.]|nr:hypothetical protein [Pseudolabrys sp.]
MNEVSGDKPLDPGAARVIYKARRLMLIASLTTFIGLAAILGVIGYRVSQSVGSAPSAVVDAAAFVPPDAKVVSTAIGDGRLAVTVAAGGGQEVRLFDLRTLQPVGRIRLTPKP